MARYALRIALVLALAFSVQAAHGAPARAAGVLRALHCCATKCHRTTSAGAAAQCCQVAPSDADTAGRAPLPHDLSPALHGVPASILALGLPAVVGAGESFSGAAARAAPVFLLSRSLRL
jgi:hypothetical protein